MHFKIPLLIGILFFSTAPSAAQLAFERSSTAQGPEYSYRWRDAAGEERSVSFTLDGEILDKAPRAQKNYRPALAQRYVAVELTKAAKTVDPKDAHVKIRQQGDSVEVSVRSRHQEKLQHIQQQFAQAREQAFSDYLEKHYYTRYITPLNQQAVKPDHIRYINEYTQALIPLSQALYEQVVEQSDAREYFNLLLGWVQSIPYNALDDRADSNGSGFAPPATLLAQNQGDCDSKSVMTAAIAKAFLPSTPMILVLLKDHALLGIGLNSKSGEQTIKVDGTSFVLIEPTGPALFRFGEVATSTLQELASGRYTIEKIQ
ncbi:hypothetical protein CA267_006155 [Alteromonas pelagimontana]|uniref:Transglutaminase domain-containing protein n=1 Tax=Alteromonas pelagimontana TaxID=1858656 RepID=A0A6M4ME11_9ALTE|nr:hypothetical protein [Alteromonas pelagimontana]QJR80386.1 hypothetical protein CA267_006155 [Alteromonas pelagimontana]